MRSKFFLVVALAGLSVVAAAPAYAQLVGTDTAPGSSCAGFPTGATRVTADADNNQRAVTLICDGTNWVVEQATFTGTCANNTPITYDNATGGLRCGAVDTIDPVWVTAAGTIVTVDVNDMINVSVSASDENGTPTYQKISGAAWISVAVNGAITGKAPATGGTYSVTVRTTDAAANSPSDRSFDIIVNPPGGPVGCTNHGDVCADGTVYAGLSPDGSVDFFVTQQDVPGSAIYSFNAGGSGWINTALPDCTDGGTESTCRNGEGNTNTLATLDSESTAGTQIHESALACYCLGETHANAPNGVVPGECTGDPAGTNAVEGHSYDDWYLPAIAELDVIYVNLVSPTDPDNPAWQDGASGTEAGTDAPNDGPQAGTFSGGFYQTSSEFTNQWARQVQMTNGYYDYWAKNNQYRVRCARK